MRLSPLGLALVVGFLGATGSPAGEARLDDCYARWNDTELTVGNAAIERSWVLQSGDLKASSLRGGGENSEWLARPGARAAGGRLDVTAMTVRRHPVEAESLSVDVAVAGGTRQIRIFPGIPGILLIGLPGNHDLSATNAPAVDELTLAPQHLRILETTLLDQTDIRNELVFEREWLLMPNEAALSLQGNAFAVEETLTGRSLAFLKFAPLPHARPEKAPADFVVTPSKRIVRVPADRYAVAVLACNGGRAGRTAAPPSTATAVCRSASPICSTSSGSAWIRRDSPHTAGVAAGPAPIPGPCAGRTRCPPRRVRDESGLPGPVPHRSLGGHGGEADTVRGEGRRPGEIPAMARLGARRAAVARGDPGDRAARIDGSLVAPAAPDAPALHPSARPGIRSRPAPGGPLSPNSPAVGCIIIECDRIH